MCMLSLHLAYFSAALLLLLEEKKERKKEGRKKTNGKMIMTFHARMYYYSLVDGIIQLLWAQYVKQVIPLHKFVSICRK